MLLDEVRIILIIVSLTHPPPPSLSSLLPIISVPVPSPLPPNPNPNTTKQSPPQMRPPTLQPRLNLLRDQTRQPFSLKRTPDIPNHPLLHLLLRLVRPRAHVRQQHHFLVRHQARVHRRLVLVHVQTATRDGVGLQGGHEGGFVDDGAACGVD